VVSRSIMRRIREGYATPSGGVHIAMSHLGPEDVRRRFKGMVERCADCGFDLAGGLVEVIPTAHYLMGGIQFAVDCTTALPRLYAAGEDTGGVHGANRLGGNGVANSTVFGGLAGQSMARAVLREGSFAAPDPTAIEAGLARAFGPLGRPAQDLTAIREALYETMWSDVGILRDEAGLRRGLSTLDSLSQAVARTGAPDGDRRYALTWMDRLNLENLILVSQAIARAALARTDSRGAHFREDFPEASDLATSRYTVVRRGEGGLALTMEPVHFTHVRPGGSLLDEAA
jgi:fumarate reductase flavoprotein subunit